MNTLAYIQDTPWAIMPEMLDTISQVVFAHMSGEKIDIEQIEASLGRKLENNYELEVRDGTAIIPIYGVIGKRMNMFTRISGGVSTELVQRDIQTALDEPDIKSILLDVDSPGGSVDGTKELSDFIYNSRGTKPIFAYANGTMASAAYWVASAADKVIGFDTSRIGSIGVITKHYDYSKQNEKRGVKVTYVYAGKYKKVGNPSEPLSKDDEAYIKDQVDQYYSLFVDSVARNRAVDVNAALAMADGKIFIGKQALDAGLINTLGTLPDTITESKKQYFLQGGTMKVKDLKENHPDLFTEVKKIGAAEVKPPTVEQFQADNPGMIIALHDEGATKERDRITALYTAIHGEDQATKFTGLIDSGATSEQFKALQAFAGEKKDEGDLKKEILDGIHKASPDSPGGGGQEAQGPATFKEAYEARKKDQKCSTAKAMKWAAKEHPELHKKYLDEANVK